jgi:hypothetical protein
MSRFYRDIKTTQERREACDPEMEDFIRAKRNPNNIPNGFDDLSRTIERTWKRHRKQKWRD